MVSIKCAEANRLRLLETISPASASYVLGEYYLVNKETINLLYESTEFWAWKAYAPLVLYLTLWGGTIVAGTTNGPIGFIQIGILLGIPLTIFGLSSDLIKPSVVIADRTFAETGVEIAPQHLRAIKALVLACSR